jgi:hypothetical protein
MHHRTSITYSEEDSYIVRFDKKYTLRTSTCGFAICLAIRPCCVCVLCVAAKKSPHYTPLITTGGVLHAVHYNTKYTQHTHTDTRYRHSKNKRKSNPPWRTQIWICPSLRSRISSTKSPFNGSLWEGREVSVKRQRRAVWEFSWPRVETRCVVVTEPFCKKNNDDKNYLGNLPERRS